jgi:hypothetical protein
LNIKLNIVDTFKNLPSLTYEGDFYYVEDKKTIYTFMSNNWVSTHLTSKHDNKLFNLPPKLQKILTKTFGNDICVFVNENNSEFSINKEDNLYNKLSEYLKAKLRLYIDYDFIIIKEDIAKCLI